MATASNRTFICSVVFLDIIEYSRKPVGEQIVLKERLNALLTEALTNVATNDRIILDTGDGAALSFLGDPEDALFVSLSLRDALTGEQPSGPELKIRVGVNLGPVKVVKDINGQPNIIGDGINVAQRVMSFCDPGQVLVSRSYYEVVSCLSEDYRKLFHYEGSRTDKHVREHEVYAVQATGTALQHAVASIPRSKAESSGSAAMLEQATRSASFVMDNLRRKPKIGTALAVIAILAIAVGIRASRQPAPPLVAELESQPAEVEVVPAPPAPETKETAATPAPDKPAAPVVATPKPAAPKPSAPAPTRTTPKQPAAKAQTASPTVRPPPPDWTNLFGTRPGGSEAPEAQAPAPEAAPVPAPAAPAGSGTLLFTVTPWGEIYVDGKRRGEVPPLYELRINAGRHRIELRHPDFPSHARTVFVKPGARLEIKHWFLPKEHPNPLDKLPWK